MAAYVQSGSQSHAEEVAAVSRQVWSTLTAPLKIRKPFGGYKISGNGRERGEIAFGEFLETKL
jgi:aldehyde dehydrogenase (NAD+)